MKARINAILLFTCILFTAVLAASAAGAAPLARPPDQAAAAVIVPAVLTVRINEVMPIPPSGGHDWVELQRVRSAHTLYHPLAGKRAASLGVASAEPSSFQPPTSPAGNSAMATAISTPCRPRCPRSR